VDRVHPQGRLAVGYRVDLSDEPGAVEHRQREVAQSNVCSGRQAICSTMR